MAGTVIPQTGSMACAGAGVAGPVACAASGVLVMPGPTGAVVFLAEAAPAAPARAPEARI